MEGGWFGNDTCWRMVLDLNRVLRYGAGDGTMRDGRRRRVFNLADAIAHVNWSCFAFAEALPEHPIRLRKGEVFTTDAITLLDFRGKGLHAFVLHAMLAHARARGIADEEHPAADPSLHHDLLRLRDLLRRYVPPAHVEVVAWRGLLPTGYTRGQRGRPWGARPCACCGG